MSEQPQNFENHAKLVPGYHGVATALLMLPTLYFLVAVFRDFSLQAVALFLFAVGVIIAVLYARLFPLGVQDRVIRLEEQLRMQRLLPEDLKGRIPEFTAAQLVGLRFASDEELPALARRVLDEGISDRKVIKQAVKNWRPDHQRI
ncbi:MAG: DUF6526 family protein [Gemmatimonadota bacterium]|nr:DUF6526 family protein [Gemmatimonadota bacterium]